MDIGLGTIFHFLGGFASGSFYIPFKGIQKWSWESYWIIGGFFSWIIIPTIAAWLTIPQFITVIQSTPVSTLWGTYMMGVLWGIGGLTYGLGIRYLGMSLGNSVTLGFCAIFGALIPTLYYNLFPQPGKMALSMMLNTQGGQLILLGVLVCTVGIAVCGKAGMLKEKDQSDHQTGVQQSEFNVMRGLIVASVSGILSSCFNFGIEYGKPMAEEAVRLGFNPLFQNNVTYVVLLWGGITTNLIWCVCLNWRNKSFEDYTNQKSPLLKNYTLAALAGTTWYLQFFFYGMGESKLGNGASSWILHMAFIILISNIWGIVLKEWKGVKTKTLVSILIGILTIIASVVVVGYGNTLL